MSNHITIELCAEDRKRIDELIAFAGLIVAEMKSRAPIPVTMDLARPTTVLKVNPFELSERDKEQLAAVEEAYKKAVDHPVDEVSPHELPEPVAEPEQPKYTKADVLAKVQQLAAPNSPHREQAKAIVKSYGAKVSDIPEDKYDEVMAKLAALEG